MVQLPGDHLVAGLKEKLGGTYIDCLLFLQQDGSRTCMLLCISLCFFVRDLKMIQTWWSGSSTI
jgi:hypothetical protein